MANIGVSVLKKEEMKEKWSEVLNRTQKGYLSILY